MASKFPTLLQLRTMLQTLAEKPSPRSLEAWLSLTKLLAILVAGLWTVAMYCSHERAFQSLLNEHQRLANEQLQFTIKQAQANAEYNLAQARLAAETAELQNKLARLEIRDRTANGVLVEHNINVSVSSKATSTYNGTFEISVENQSKSPVEISWAAFELYIGHVPPRGATTGVVFVNPPPNQELEQAGEQVPVFWEHQVTYGYVYPSSKSLNYDVFKPFNYYKTGGPLMKTLSAGESTTFRMPLVIAASSDRWVAVVTSFGMDGALSGEKVFNAADWVDLRSAAQNGR